jgi:hypothetical protein
MPPLFFAASFASAAGRTRFRRAMKRQQIAHAAQRSVRDARASALPTRREAEEAQADAAAVCRNAPEEERA